MYAGQNPSHQPTAAPEPAMSNTDRIRARPVEQDALLNFGGYDEAIPLADLGLDRSGPRMPDGASGGFARPNLNLAGNRSPSRQLVSLPLTAHHFILALRPFCIRT